MTEALIGVLAGTYSFNLRTLVMDVLEHWPGTWYFPDWDHAEVMAGRLEIKRDAEPGYELAVQMFPDCRALALDVTSPDLAAEFLGYLTCSEGFPEDGSVAIALLDEDLCPLYPDMTWDELVAATSPWPAWSTP